MRIDVAAEFSPYPAGRFPEDGQFNGERFRNEILVPALRRLLSDGKGEKLTVDIDGVRTFGSSFIEEAFAGLIRYRLFPRDIVQKTLQIQSTKPYLTFYRDAIVSTINGARAEMAS